MARDGWRDFLIFVVGAVIGLLKNDAPYLISNVRYES